MPGQGLLQYETLIDAVLGRRPYAAGETRGSVLLTTAASLRGHNLSVTASVPGIAGATWRWQVVPRNGSDTLFFSLTTLPPTLNADMAIQVSGAPSGDVAVLRRLMRAPPRATAPC